MRQARIWLGLGIVMLANFLVLFAQTLVAFWKWRHLGPAAWLLPEARYFLQGFVLLIPIIPIVFLRFRHGRKILIAVLAALAVHAGAFLVKAHVPGARRQQYVAACDWAVERIRADYRGPKADAEPYFSWLEYHPLARPCIEAHVTRVAYLLGGRGASLAGCGLVDIPDYIVDETHRVNRAWWNVAGYEKLAEKSFGKRDFVIYKRVK